MDNTTIDLTATRQARALAEVRETEAHVLEALDLLTMMALTGDEHAVNAGLINLKLELRAYQAAIMSGRTAGVTPELNEIAATTMRDLLPGGR